LEKSDRKIFGTLFFSIFVTVTGVGIVVPLLPIYAHELGAGGFGIGLLFGSFSISRTLFIPYFGRLSDRRGRKPLIVPGLLAYALLSLAFIQAASVPALIAIRFAQGIASSALMPAIQAYVGDITPPGREGATMGLFNLSLFFGLALGPLLGGGLRDHFGIAATFAGMAALAFAGFVLTALLLPPAKRERIVCTSRPLGPWRSLLQDRELAGLLLFRLAYTFGIGILWSFLPVLAATDFALSGAAIGLLVMVGVTVSGALQFPMGALADRTDKRRLIVLGGMVAAGGLLAFEWVRGFEGLLAANFLFGLGGGISMPALTALAVQKGSRTAMMGSVMAVLTLAHSAGMFAGALLAGIMMDLFGLRRVFPVGALVIAFVAALFYLASAAAGRPAGRG
jgi:MFS family permease